MAASIQQQDQSGSWQAAALSRQQEAPSSPASSTLQRHVVDDLVPDRPGPGILIINDHRLDLSTLFCRLRPRRTGTCICTKVRVDLLKIVWWFTPTGKSNTAARVHVGLGLPVEVVGLPHVLDLGVHRRCTIVVLWGFFSSTLSSLSSPTPQSCKNCARALNRALQLAFGWLYMYTTWSQ